MEIFQKIYTRKYGLAHTKTPSFKIGRKILITQLPLKLIKRQSCHHIETSKSIDWFLYGGNFGI